MLAPHPSQAAIEILNARLTSTGYGSDALRDLLGVVYPDDVGVLNHAPALERLRGRSEPAAILARLLYLESAEPLGKLRRLIGSRECDQLVAAGLLARRAGNVLARLRLDLVGRLRLLADRRFRSHDQRALRLPAGDMVYPPGADSVVLAQVVAPLRASRVLDLCTGSGVQGLTVAPAAADVIGIDISARAATLARVNAALNDVPNFSTRVGNLFAPVRGQRFDLVIANPPFVPGLTRGPAYHSGGPRGDRVLRRIVAGLGDHLSGGGRAVIISHLALREGEDAAAVIAPWLGRFHGRAVVLVLESGTPVDLAAAQALFALNDGLAAYARELRQWVAYLARQRVREILLVLLVAESGRPRPLEVTQAFQRTLPLPLAKAPADLVRDWLKASGGEG